MVLTRVKKPSAVLFDLCGTVTKTSFIDHVLFPFIKTNLKTYFEENWDTPEAQSDIEALRTASSQDQNAPQIANVLERSQLLDAVEKYVLYCMENKKESRALSLLRFHIWFDGYEKNRLVTSIYFDVLTQMKKWHIDNGILLYVLSNGWSEATKRFLQKTNHGNIDQLVQEHFDSRMGPLNLPATYLKVVEQIGQPAANVLFLTKDGLSGCAAKEAGLNVVLVLTHRRNIEKLTKEERQIPRVRSFNEIEWIE